MKNKIPTLYSLMVLMFLCACDNEPYEGEFFIDDNSCDLAIEASLFALDNFNLSNDDNFSILCQVYRDALQNQIEICGDEDDTLQFIIDGLSSCTQESNPCEDAILATDLAFDNYFDSTDDNFETLCQAYKLALLNQIQVCGDDGVLLAMVEELGTCEVFEIEGTWQLSLWISENLRDLDNDGVVTNQYLNEIDCYNNETITFNEDGTGTFFYRSTAEISYTPINNSTEEEDYAITCNVINESIQFTWVQVGNTYSITMPNSNVVNHFRNGNGLYVAYDDGFFVESTIDGFPNISERITFVYYKL